MADIRIPDALARRLEAYASANGRARELVAKEAIEREIDFDAWWKCEVEKGIEEADAGKLRRLAVEVLIDATGRRHV